MVMEAKKIVVPTFWFTTGRRAKDVTFTSDSSADYDYEEIEVDFPRLTTAGGLPPLFTNGCGEKIRRNLSMEQTF